MVENAVVRARVSEKVKRGASEVLAGMGLTVSDAVRMMLVRVANDGTLPFDLVPNEVTAETLARSQRGEGVHHADSADDLFRKLKI